MNKLIKIWNLLFLKSLSFYLSYDGLSTKQILEKQGEFFKLPEINLLKEIKII